MDCSLFSTFSTPKLGSFIGISTVSMPELGSSTVSVSIISSTLGISEISTSKLSFTKKLSEPVPEGIFPYVSSKSTATTFLLFFSLNLF